jgi:hypothetical protein
MVSSSHPTSLWRNRDYLLLWSGQTISGVGSSETKSENINYNKESGPLCSAFPLEQRRIQLAAIFPL